MKAPFLCFALLLISAGSFAQKTLTGVAFDRAVFDSIMGRYA